MKSTILCWQKQCSMSVYFNYCANLERLLDYWRHFSMFLMCLCVYVFFNSKCPSWQSQTNEYWPIQCNYRLKRVYDSLKVTVSTWFDYMLLLVVFSVVVVVFAGIFISIPIWWKYHFNLSCKFNTQNPNPIIRYHRIQYCI